MPGSNTCVWNDIFCPVALYKNLGRSAGVFAHFLSLHVFFKFAKTSTTTCREHEVRPSLHDEVFV